MTMTLQELSEELRMYAGRPEGIHVDPSAFSVWADAVTAHISQPQPVAQGEAVACAEVVIDPSTGNRQLVTYFANGVTPDVGTKLYTIPTGHRVVPIPFAIERTHKNQAFVTLGFDSVDDCTAFIKALSSTRHVLTTSPSAGGV